MDRNLTAMAIVGIKDPVRCVLLPGLCAATPQITLLDKDRGIPQDFPGEPQAWQRMHAFLRLSSGPLSYHWHVHL